MDGRECGARFVLGGIETLGGEYNPRASARFVVLVEIDWFPASGIDEQVPLFSPAGSICC